MIWTCRFTYDSERRATRVSVEFGLEMFYLYRHGKREGGCFRPLTVGGPVSPLSVLSVGRPRDTLNGSKHVVRGIIEKKDRKKEVVVTVKE